MADERRRRHRLDRPRARQVGAGIAVEIREVVAGHDAPKPRDRADPSLAHADAQARGYEAAPLAPDQHPAFGEKQRDLRSAEDPRREIDELAGDLTDRPLVVKPRDQPLQGVVKEIALAVFLAEVEVLLLEPLVALDAAAQLAVLEAELRQRETGAAQIEDREQRDSRRRDLGGRQPYQEIDDVGGDTQLRTLPSWKIGRYMATTMSPIVLPTPTMKIGSRSEASMSAITLTSFS